MSPEEYLKKYLSKDYEKGLEAYKKGKPLQYIVGNVDFYDLNLKVNENVLIPRFETEYLVQKTINYAEKIFTDKINILDIGTGSGAIALTLKKHLNANVIACDISKEALTVAKENSLKNNLNVEFIQSDLFENINGKFDIIISNPPYIAVDEEIEEIVKNNEPHLALFAEDDGLYFYKKILKEAKKYLNDKSILAFEIGMNQGEKLKEIARKYFNESTIKIEKDLTKKDRYLFIFNKIILSNRK